MALCDEKRLRHHQIDGYLAGTLEHIPSEAAERAGRILPEGARVEIARDQLGVRPRDRVYQGFSLAFDASVEEIWLAFRSGARLVAATPDMERAGPDLPRLLSERAIHLIDTVDALQR